VDRDCEAEHGREEFTGVRSECSGVDGSLCRMNATKTHRGEVMRLVCPPDLRTHSADLYIWRGPSGDLAVTDDEAAHFGVVPYRALLVNPVED